jgi:hypothetical protein
MLVGLTNLENLSIGQPGLNDETLKHLAKQAKLKQLSWMFWGDVTMSGLKTLNELAGLESLQAERVHQDNQGLDLSGLRNLRVLEISMFVKTSRVGDELVYTGDTFHDSDLACLSGLTELENLRLNGRGIGDEGLKHLASLTRLKYLTIGGGPGLTNAGLRHLANLHRLDDLFIGDSRITEDGLACLYPLKTLHLLRIATTAPISRQAIARLSTELPHLQTLEFPPPQPMRIKVPPSPKARGS